MPQVELPGATASTLLIPAATTADAGTYTCMVSNAAGSVVWGEAVVSVRGPRLAQADAHASEPCMRRAAAGCVGESDSDQAAAERQEEVGAACEDAALHDDSYAVTHTASAALPQQPQRPAPLSSPSTSCRISGPNATLLTASLQVHQFPALRKWARARTAFEQVEQSRALAVSHALLRGGPECTQLLQALRDRCVPRVRCATHPPAAHACVSGLAFALALDAASHYCGGQPLAFGLPPAQSHALEALQELGALTALMRVPLSSAPPQAADARGSGTAPAMLAALEEASEVLVSCMHDGSARG